MTSIKPEEFYKVSENLGYNAEGYRKAMHNIKRSKAFLEDLPPITRNAVLPVVREIVEGTVRALREIYLPLIDKGKLEEIKASPYQDFYTDLRGLDDLLKIFE